MRNLPLPPFACDRVTPASVASSATAMRRQPWNGRAVLLALVASCLTTVLGAGMAAADDDAKPTAEAKTPAAGEDAQSASDKVTSDKVTSDKDKAGKDESPQNEPAKEAGKDQPASTTPPSTTPASAGVEKPPTTAAPTTTAANAQTSPAPAARYVLRYMLQAGETLRWEVEHRARVRTTLNGVTQISETASDSTKVWKIVKADEDAFTFVHSVDKVLMREKTTGRVESVYNSETDRDPPLGFESAAKNVKTPLATITLDNRGNVLKREETAPQPLNSDTQPTIPLPDEPVAVGDEWSSPHLISVPRKDRTYMQIKSMQRYKLEKVSAGIATISVKTAILTAVNDPFIEAQLVQRETVGSVRFDIAAGRVIEQRTDLNKHVVGHIGENSSMQFTMSYVEKLVQSRQTALKPGVAGPTLE